MLTSTIVPERQKGRNRIIGGGKGYRGGLSKGGRYKSSASNGRKKMDGEKVKGAFWREKGRGKKVSAVVREKNLVGSMARNRKPGFDCGGGGDSSLFSLSPQGLMALAADEVAVGLF